MKPGETTLRRALEIVEREIEAERPTRPLTGIAKAGRLLAAIRGESGDAVLHWLEGIAEGLRFSLGESDELGGILKDKAAQDN